LARARALIALKHPAADEVIDQRFEQHLSDTTNRLNEPCVKGDLDKNSKLFLEREISNSCLETIKFFPTPNLFVESRVDYSWESKLPYNERCRLLNDPADLDNIVSNLKGTIESHSPSNEQDKYMCLRAGISAVLKRRRITGHGCRESSVIVLHL
jgi:hypothetical protein